MNDNFKIIASVDSKILINYVDYKRSQGLGRGNGSSYVPSKKKVCIHCGRNEHTINTCDNNLGLPPNFGKSIAMSNIFSPKLNEANKVLLMILRAAKEMVHALSLRINITSW